MTNLMALFAVAAVGIAGGAPPQSSAIDRGAIPPHAAIISTPTWVRTPTSDQVARSYPSGAPNHGSARIVCSATPQGELVDCKLVAEDPPGAGFGGALLKLARYFKMAPVTRDGIPVAGGRVLIPVHFAR